MNKLANIICVHYRGVVPPLKGKELTSLPQKLGNRWNVMEDNHLEKQWEFDDFQTALIPISQSLKSILCSINPVD